MFPWRFGRRAILLFVAAFASVSVNVQALYSSGLQEGDMKKCLVVAAYHDLFPGQYLKLEGVRDRLEGGCEIRQFNMDTKRNPQPEFCRTMALRAKDIIDAWKPDIVIGLDDNTSKYLIQPYLRDTELPVVFCGIDWTAKEYGYPYSNATGIIEVYPLKQLIAQVERIVPEPSSVVCIRGERLSEEKDVVRYAEVFGLQGIQLIDRPVRTFSDFKQEFIKAQRADFIILQDNSGIEGWDDTEARDFVFRHSGKLTVSLLEWMSPFTMLAITQVVKEQGEYAGSIAKLLLEGAQVSDFPIIANKKWNVYVNRSLLEKVEIEIPPDLLRKARSVEE